MVRGRPPKPTAVKEANGSLRHDPQRRNHFEPKPQKGEPPMPEWVKLDPVAAMCWRSTCDLLAGLDLLTIELQHPLEGYCSDFAQWRILRTAVAGGNVGEITQSGTSVRVEERQLHKYQDRMNKFWSECGFTPSGRARLIVKQAEDSYDPSAELDRRMDQD